MLFGGWTSVSTTMSFTRLFNEKKLKTNKKKQMMAGLGSQERKELGLAGYTVRDLRYLTSLLFVSLDLAFCYFDPILIIFCACPTGIFIS